MACRTLSSYREIIEAAIAKDSNRFYGMVVDGKCIITKAGIPIRLLERVSIGIYKVRITTPDGAASMVFFTPSENVRKVK